MDTPRTSSRDAQSLLDAFGAWLDTEVGPAEPPRISSLGGPSGAGLSSDTLLLDIEWSEADGANIQRVVLRLPPTADAFPIFETYDLARQVEAMRVVRENCTAPVPEIIWAETTGSAIGVPFFVMERIDGLVPPDILPYTWGSWVTELPEDDLRSMTHDAIDALTQIHSIDPTDALLDAARRDAEGTTFLERHMSKMRRAFDWAKHERSFPTIERGFELLSGTMPTVDRDDVLLWGDARIGNILWNDARAVAILDWEMTTIGPRELDVAWLAYFAMTFQSSAEARGHTGVPTLLRCDDIVDRYQRSTDTTLVAFDWFLALTSLHQCIIAIRTSDRSIALDGAEPGDDPEAPLHPIPTLVQLLDIVERTGRQDH